MYTSAPLPFTGQKRGWVKQYKEVLNHVANDIDIVVDLFGGSGLLSHIAKRVLPKAQVIYNDFDGYSKRISAIPSTNKIVGMMRGVCSGLKEHQHIPSEIKNKLIAILNEVRESDDAADWITLGSQLVFSGKRTVSYDDLVKHTFYYNFIKRDYNADGYLDGLEIVNSDYKELLRQYGGNSRVLFVLDPPYLNTDNHGYGGGKIGV